MLKTSERRIRCAIVAILFILFARRYAQWIRPQVWDEEGILITQAVAHGLASFFLPIAGYLVVLPRAIVFASLLFPLSFYPRAATVLTWVATIALMVSIVKVPSRLSARSCLVLCVMLVPSDAEVFGLSLYAFWWSTIVLYASAFWVAGRGYLWLRLGVVVVAGLSAPFIVLVFPLFAISAFRSRNREDIAVAFAAFACAAAQTMEFALSHGAVVSNAPALVPLVSKFVGGYLVWNLFPNGHVRDLCALGAGLCVVAFLGVAVFSEECARGKLLPLLYLWLGSIALAVARVDVTILDQATAGPRYFFLSFALLGWILVQLTRSKNRTTRLVSAAMLVCACFNALPVLSRKHDDLAWKQSVRSCDATAGNVPYGLPIEIDGSAAHQGIVPLTGDECRKLDSAGLFGLL